MARDRRAHLPRRPLPRHLRRLHERDRRERRAAGEDRRGPAARHRAQRVRDSSSSTIAATMVLETAIEMAFSVVLVVVVLLAGRSVGSLGAPLDGVRRRDGHPSTPFVAVAGAVLLVVGIRVCRAAPASRGADMGRGFAVVGAPARSAASVLAWKVLAWVFRLAAVYFFLVAFHLPATAWTVLLVVAAQVAASLVPLLPGQRRRTAGGARRRPGRATRPRAERRRARRRHAGRDERRRPCCSAPWPWASSLRGTSCAASALPTAQPARRDVA